MRKPKKARTQPQLIKDLDKVFSKYIRKNAKYCFTCGQTSATLQAGHYIPRRFMETRFDEMNVKPQCIYCNYTLEGNAISFREGLVHKYGLMEIEDMEYRRHNTKKWSKEELKELIV